MSKLLICLLIFTAIFHTGSYFTEEETAGLAGYPKEYLKTYTLDRDQSGVVSLIRNGRGFIVKRNRKIQRISRKIKLL